MKKLILAILTALLLLTSCSDYNIYKEEINICGVGDVYFDTLQAAVDYIGSSRAVSEDRTVYLLKNVLRGEYDDSIRKGVTVPATFEGDLKIDFGGYRYDFSSKEQYFFRFLGGNTIEVVNGTSVIYEDSISTESALIVGTRTVTIDEHLIKDLRNTKKAVEVTKDGSLIIKATDNAKAGLSGEIVITEGGSLEFKGGSFNITDIKETGNADFKIYSGEVTFPHAIEDRIDQAISAVPEEEKGEVKTNTKHGPSFILHEAVPATCYTVGYPEYYECSICHKLFKDIGLTQETTLEELVISKLTHNLIYHEAKAQTCTESGNKEYWQCSLCGHYFSDENAETKITQEDILIPSYGGHDYPEEWTIVKEATCTETGLKTKTCLREGCGYVLEEVIPALGHSYGDWYVTKAPTCTETGLKQHDCIRCDHFETEVIPALGHELGDWYITVAATCTKDGEERRDCSRCDYFETRIIQAKGHTSNGTIYGENHPTQHWYHCDIDNVDFDFENHTYGNWEDTETPGKTAQRTCTKCGHIDYTALDHIWHYTAPVNPDCTTNGNYGYWWCEIHSSEYTSDEEHQNIITWNNIFRPALGHDMEYHAYKEATCREDGNKEYWHCSRCGKNYSDSKGNTELLVVVIPHHTVNAVSAKAPTCTEDGNIAYWYCVNDKKYFSNEACTTEITQAETIIRALGHDHTGPWVNTDKDYHWKVCKREGCGVIIYKSEHFYEITYDFDASKRNLTMTSVCECGRNLSSSTTSDTGAFDISTVFGDIRVERTSSNSWKLWADETKVKYCSWSGEDGVTLLTGPEPFSISCQIAGSGKYKIFCHVQDRFGKEIDIYFVEFTKYE